MELNLRSNCRYAIACPTSMGVRITPTDRMAVHNSDMFRMQATSATCYTRKYSSYLPQWDYIIEPFFKREYKSKELFFEVTDELKRDRAAFTKYANHILSVLMQNY